MLFHGHVRGAHGHEHISVYGHEHVSVYGHEHISVYPAMRAKAGSEASRCMVPSAGKALHPPVPLRRRSCALQPGF